MRCIRLVTLAFFVLTGSVMTAQGNPAVFAPAVAYGSGGSQAASAAVADVNGDGKPDLVVANACGSIANCAGSVGVLLGNGDGTFQTAVTYGSGGQGALWVAIADLNGDGKPDLVVMNSCANSSDCSIGTVGVLLGNGDGTFQPTVTYGSGGVYAESIAVADVNGDGRPDLVAGNFCANYTDHCSLNGSVDVLLGSGEGAFQPPITYGSGGYGVVGVAIADLNGDGKPDLVVTNCGVSGCGSGGAGNGVLGALLGNGDGTFRPAVTYGSGGVSAQSAAVADLNGDGKLDILVANLWVSSSNLNGTVGALLGNGNGAFQTTQTYPSGGFRAHSIAAADLNGDGKPDIVVANIYADSNLRSSSISPPVLALGKNADQQRRLYPFSPAGNRIRYRSIDVVRTRHKNLALPTSDCGSRIPMDSRLQRKHCGTSGVSGASTICISARDISISAF